MTTKTKPPTETPDQRIDRKTKHYIALADAHGTQKVIRHLVTILDALKADG